MTSTPEEERPPLLSSESCVSRLEGAGKTFESAGGPVKAVEGATLAVSRGEMLGIMGPSGSGKTTLLKLMGMLDAPSSGTVFFEEKSVRELPVSARRRIRLSKVGFIFQQLRLIPNLSVMENVELPMALQSKTGEFQRTKARELIEAVGLAGKERRRPGKLSVGEQQRVAVARAIANDPLLILADEPTSQLDSASGEKIVDLLDVLRKRVNAAIVITTHDPSIISLLGRVYQMRDGILTAVR